MNYTGWGAALCLVSPVIPSTATWTLTDPLCCKYLYRYTIQLAQTHSVLNKALNAITCEEPKRSAKNCVLNRCSFIERYFDRSYCWLSIKRNTNIQQLNLESIDFYTQLSTLSRIQIESSSEKFEIAFLRRFLRYRIEILLIILTDLRHD